jgi:ribosomal protein S20
LLNLKIQKILQNEDLEALPTIKSEGQILLNSLYSIIDKAVKKNVIHKNTAARKKSNALKIFRKI